MSDNQPKKGTRKRFKCPTYMSEFIFKYYHEHEQYRIKTYFPNEKEVSESVGAFNAIMKYMKGMRYKTNVNCYVIGDGKYPTTGMLIVTNTWWNVWSIDPNLKITESERPRLKLFGGCSEDFVPESAEYNIIVSVHGHGDINEFYDKLSGKKLSVSIPCCLLKKQVLDVHDLLEMYHDDKILTKANQVWIHGNLIH